MNRFACKAVVSVAAALFALRPAAAIDTWLVAESDVVDAKSPVWIALVTGDAFPLADGIIDPARIDGVFDHVEKLRLPIDGLRAEDDAMAVRYTFDQPGLHRLSATLHPRVITLDGSIFDQYLIEERANEALVARQADTARQAPVQERYIKYAKSIIEVGPVDDDDRSYLTPVGHRLELIPLTNPTRWQAGEVVELQVLLDGHPWPEVPVTAGFAGQVSGDAAVRARSDERGIVSLRLTQSGHWYVRSHLIRPHDGLGVCDWESFWTTLTFRVKGKVDVSGSLQMLRAIHGRTDPWAVAGFLMGERALIELRLPYNSPEFLAVQHGPIEQPYAAMLDGIQAATGATAGKLNLKLKPGPLEGLRCEFLHMATGEGVVYRLTDEMLERLRDAQEEGPDRLAVRMMAMPPEEVFHAGADPRSPQPAPSRDDLQSHLWDNARRRDEQLRPLIRLASARARMTFAEEPLIAREVEADARVVVAFRDEATVPAQTSPAATPADGDARDSEAMQARGTKIVDMREAAADEHVRPRRRRGLAESLWHAENQVSPGDEQPSPLPVPVDGAEVRITAR